MEHLCLLVLFISEILMRNFLDEVLVGQLRFSLSSFFRLCKKLWSRERGCNFRKQDFCRAKKKVWNRGRLDPTFVNRRRVENFVTYLTQAHYPFHMQEIFL